MANQSRDIYASSNGDRWTLEVDGSGNPVVRHTPTVSSGGTSVHIEVADFLSKDRGSPQHQELLRLIGSLVEGEPVQQPTLEEIAPAS